MVYSCSLQDYEQELNEKQKLLGGFRYGTNNE